MIKCEIAMKLPSLNDYIGICRQNRYKSAKMKKNIESDIGMFIGRLPKLSPPVIIHFHWIESDRRRDLDNIAFAKKFVLDALVKFGKIPDDSSRYVSGFTDSFEYADETKLILFIEEDKK